MINRVYYVEGLNHNLFSVGQFCDEDLEVAFWNSTCFVRDLQGNDLLTGNRGSDLYTISIQETTSLTLICFIAKASPSQAWLWHRRISHLNFDYINLLSKKDVMIGLPKLKYVKDKLCSSYEVSKSKRSSFKIKVIVDDYSRYTWTLFLRSKDETQEVLKDFLIMIRQNLQDPVISVRTDRADTTALSQQELDLLFGPLYDEFFNAGTSSVNKSSSPTDNSKQQDIPPIMNNPSSTEPTTPTTNVHNEENNDNQADNTQVQQDEFSNPFCTPVAMADSAWIEAMQEELHQFDRLQVWELIDKPYDKNIIKLKWKRVLISRNGTDNQEKDEKQRQNDKTGLGMEKTVKDKAKSKPESQSSQKVNRKVNWSKSKSTQVNPE
ncbi:retrovirus-related pol polyprotein from transposon TNT 1-94, partial [Tanacetum coccineum]